MGESRTDAEASVAESSAESDRTARHTVKGMVPLQRPPATVDEKPLERLNDSATDRT
jgi:hypothetical protein